MYGGILAQNRHLVALRCNIHRGRRKCAERTALTVFHIQSVQRMAASIEKFAVTERDLIRFLRKRQRRLSSGQDIVKTARV